VGRYNEIVNYVYILELNNGEYYVGFSTNLGIRLQEHKSGRIKATRNHRPLKLMFYAAFKTKMKALRFERYLKSSSGFAFRNKRLV